MCKEEEVIAMWVTLKMQVKVKLTFCDQNPVEMVNEMLEVFEVYRMCVEEDVIITCMILKK